MDSFLCNKLQSSSPQVLQFQSKRMLWGSAAVQVIWVLGGGAKVILSLCCAPALSLVFLLVRKVLLVWSLLLCGGTVSNMGIWWEWFRSLAVQVAATPLAMLFCQPANLVPFDQIARLQITYKNVSLLCHWGRFGSLKCNILQQFNHKSNDFQKFRSWTESQRSWNSYVGVGAAQYVRSRSWSGATTPPLITSITIMPFQFVSTLNWSHRP